MSGSATTPRELDRASATPLWAQLEEDLQRRLADGAFEMAFPGEHELAGEYGVSRHTVREALRRMRASGVVDSTRGRGSSIRHAAIEQPLGALYSLFRSVEATGVEQRSKVRVLEVRRNPAVSEALGIDPDSELVFLERLRLADGEPLALDRSFLPRSVGEPLLAGVFEHTSLYGELARLTGIRLNGGREAITAVVADSPTRRLLGIKSDVAVLAVTRIGCLDGRPLEFRESLIRGDRFSLSAEWPGTAGYRVDVAGMKGSNGG
ncbi:GntR family transcriptional regulator [Sporichthya sp.]|uniref:GntR family transcriptional regulator n=1 Tax=Sporichthya sp. TaxID=65475 RepID=UPI00184072B4|nr:GntR family transcriptional regulator [Sporichthya sp.]MBA3741737.1 GntR family transcriptional regulator [Sporichthya sp.]